MYYSSFNDFKIYDDKYRLLVKCKTTFTYSCEGQFL